MSSNIGNFFVFPTNDVITPGGRVIGNDWTEFASYSSGFEADLAIGQLESAGIPTLRDSHDTVGIFGPGFQGKTSHGVTVSVPTLLLDDARRAVTLVDGTGECLKSS